MIQFPSMPNFRPLANGARDTKEEGCKVEDGLINDEVNREGRLVDRQKRKLGKLYRSSCPDFLTEEEAELFKSINFKSIIDFRSRMEYFKSRPVKLIDRYYSLYKVKVPIWRKYEPHEEIKCELLKLAECSIKGPFDEKSDVEKKHYLINFFNLNYVWEVFNRVSIFWRFISIFYLLFDLILGTDNRYFVRLFVKKTLNKEGLVGQYIDILNHSRSSICAALKLLCDSKNIPAMLNCAHGKDRTGITSALVLSCLGYSRDYICDDYAKSSVHLAPIQKILERDIVEKYHMCRTFMSADCNTMKQVLDYIEEKCGGVPKYLESIGFSIEDQQKLRENLMD